MSDDVRERAQKIIEECEYQFSAMRQDARAAEVIAALEAAGIALIDAASLRELEKQITDLLEQLEEWKLLARGF